MLKKILHIVLVLFLTVATSGFTISRHYCMDHLFSVSLFSAKKCYCGDQCKDCHTNSMQIKVTDNYAAPEAIHPEGPTTSDVWMINNFAFSSVTVSENYPAFNLIKAPPPGGNDPIAFLQSFRC